MMTWTPSRSRVRVIRSRNRCIARRKQLLELVDEEHEVGAVGQRGCYVSQGFGAFDGEKMPRLSAQRNGDLLERTLELPERLEPGVHAGHDPVL